MQDLKSYTINNKRSGFSFVKRLVLSLLLLCLIGMGALYLIKPAEQRQPNSDTADSAPNTQKSEQLTLPLTLPNQPPEEGRNLPPSSANEHKHSASPAITQALPSEQPPTEVAATVIQPKQTETLTQDNSQWKTHQVVSGDSLSSIFKKMGLSANLLHRITRSSASAKTLTHIKPGELIRVELDQQDQFKSLVLEHNKRRSLQITATDEGFRTNQLTRDVERRTSHIQGTIQDSLYLSAKAAGMPESLIMELANIFGWDIDFALEIREGDRFTMIYQEEYLDGEKLKDGPILAAEFINQGRSYRAVRYEDEAGHAHYYTPEGRSMRKAFLRAPVDFRRISSRFTKARWHPVLGKKRPHRGVDYAAKIGTPIKASGDGRIIHRGRKGGYGNTVIIQHGQQYTTLYAHLSRYNKKAKMGSKVKQGQVIGYVGKTGLATGPHLHYEFRINGVHRNPLTVKLPAAEPIAKKYRNDFLIKTQPLLAQLDTLHRIIVADAR